VADRSSLTEIRARIAANNMAWFQREIDSEVDENRQEILARLLAIELARIADEQNVDEQKS
jgi:hypothetical protein